MNIGHSSKLVYDDCAYHDKLKESVGHLLHQLDPTSIQNCQGCFTSVGPRSSYKGFGIDLYNKKYNAHSAESQNLVDLESILTNRNVPSSKCKNGKVNSINVLDYGLDSSPQCDNYLDPMSSRLMEPSKTYKSMSINRFLDLSRNPQAPIFWNFAINTSLEAKDTYTPKIPIPQNQHWVPISKTGLDKYPCKIQKSVMCQNVKCN